ncbi:dihydropteroate synthase [Candidatus Kapabacteria bacterium]|nr:dihydropteroate synthase [Candidatus Kapabacteria bacterium]
MHKPIFPKIMGIVNVTPDSFSDGGDYNNLDKSLEHSFNMLENGADILDIGGESTRPGAEAVNEQQELDRVIPLIQEILKKKPNSYISLDTSKYEVAKLGLEAGVSMINDVSGLKSSPEIAELVANHDADLCIMHMQGNPRTMQQNPKYDNLIDEVKTFLETQAAFAKKNGVRKVFVDVGIGFGKTPEDNINLLKNLELFSNIGNGQLLGISRKSFIGKYIGLSNPKQRDVPTVILHSLLLNKKLSIVRVHKPQLLAQLKKCYEILA